MGFTRQGSGLRLYGLESGVWRSGFRVQGSWLGVWGAGYVWGVGQGYLRRHVEVDLNDTLLFVESHGARRGDQ